MLSTEEKVAIFVLFYVDLHMNQSRRTSLSNEEKSAPTTVAIEYFMQINVIW